MAGKVNRLDLAPPKDVVLNARMVLGAIDFDPYSTKDINRLVMAARFFDRDNEDFDDVIRKDWKPIGKRRAFAAPPVGAGATRRLLNKVLREYRKGIISEAVFWIAHNESITKAPWLWDFPICIPFTRLRGCWWDDEMEEFRRIQPADWSAVVYMPPSESSNEFHAKISRFHTAFSPMGRIIFNELSGENDWEKSYEALYKRPYNYRD